MCGAVDARARKSTHAPIGEPTRGAVDARAEQSKDGRSGQRARGAGTAFAEWSARAEQSNARALEQSNARGSAYQPPRKISHAGGTPVMRAGQYMARTRRRASVC